MPEEKRTAQVVVRVRPSLKKQIDARARDERRTPSNLIEGILEDAMGKKKPA